MFKLDNFGVILFVSFSYKKLLNVHFMKILKIDAKNDFSAKNSKKFVYYNEELVTNSKFQTQLSRKLQRFRTCRKNKKCSIFHELFEYQQKWQLFPLDWSFKLNYSTTSVLGVWLRYWGIQFLASNCGGVWPISRPCSGIGTK